MNKYVCKIISSTGNIKKDMFKEDIEEVYEYFESRGIEVISVNKSSIYDIEKRINSKLKDKEIFEFISKLRTLLKAGVPLNKCLEIIGRQTKKKQVKIKIKIVEDSVLEGNSIKTSFEKGEFPVIVCRYIGIGESSGKIEEALNGIEDLYRDKIEIERKFKNSMVYPGIVTGVILTAIVISLNYTIPSYVEIFANSDEQLPLATKYLIKISETIKDKGEKIVIGGIIVFIAILIGKETEKGSFLLDRLKLITPIYKTYYKKKVNYKFSIGMWIMLSSTKNIIEAIKISGNLVNNKVVSKNLKNIIEKIKEGEKISSLLKEYNEYDEILIYLCEVGEEVGQLDEVFLKLSKMYKEDLNKYFIKFQKNVEIGITIFLGGVIGFVMLGIILPMFNLINII